MKNFEAVNQIHAFSKAMKGTLAGLVLVMFSTTNMSVFDMNISPVFLPVFAILFWPVKASYTWSLLGVMGIGLFQDVLSAGPLGAWALVYLALFFILGRGVKTKMPLWNAWWLYAVFILFAALFVTLIGKLILRIWPDMSGLMANAVLSVLIFPICYFIRSLIVPEARQARIRERGTL